MIHKATHVSNSSELEVVWISSIYTGRDSSTFPRHANTLVQAPREPSWQNWPPDETENSSSLAMATKTCLLGIMNSEQSTKVLGRLGDAQKAIAAFSARFATRDLLKDDCQRQIEVSIAIVEQASY